MALEEYLEIRRIRVELEGMAAAAAATNARPQDIQTLRSMVAYNEEAVSESRKEEAIASNQDFHFELCRIARMPQLAEILERLWLKMGPLIAQCYTAGGRTMIDYHYPVVDAVQRNDPNAARIAMQNDILSGGQAILEFKSGSAGSNVQIATPDVRTGSSSRIAEPEHRTKKVG